MPTDLYQQRHALLTGDCYKQVLVLAVNNVLCTRTPVLILCLTITVDKTATGTCAAEALNVTLLLRNDCKQEHMYL